MSPCENELQGWEGLTRWVEQDHVVACVEASLRKGRCDLLSTFMQLDACGCADSDALVKGTDSNKRIKVRV